LNQITHSIITVSDLEELGACEEGRELSATEMESPYVDVTTELESASLHFKKSGTWSSRSNSIA